MLTKLDISNKKRLHTAEGLLMKRDVRKKTYYNKLLCCKVYKAELHSGRNRLKIPPGSRSEFFPTV